MAEGVEIGDRRASGQDEVALAHAQVAAAKAEVAAAKAEVAAAKADVAEAETKFKDALAEWSATPLEDDHVRSVLWFQVMIAQEAVKTAQEAIKTAQDAIKTALEAVKTAETHLKSCIERADRLADFTAATKRRKVMLPSSSERQKQAIKDLTRLSNIPLHSEELTFDCIRQHLSHPLADILARAHKQCAGPKHFCITEQSFYSLQEADPEESSAYVVEEGRCSEISDFIVALTMTPCVGFGEASLHWATDNLLIRPLSWGLSAILRRDMHASCTNAGTRRDFHAAIQVGSGLYTVLQGEEKTVEAYQAGHIDKDPVQQLTSRTPWHSWSTFFGSAELTLAFTVLGSATSVMFQFGALVKASQQFLPLHTDIDILRPEGRIAVLHLLLRLLPHMRCLAGLACAAGAMPLKWRREEQCRGGVAVSLKLEVNEGVVYVQKRWRGAELGWLHDVKRIYMALRAADPDSKHFQQLVWWTEGVQEMRASFTPFGNPTWSKQQQGLVALEHVIEAVAVMHSQMVVHRDLRWDNVVLNPPAKRFILIDFDDALMLGGGRRAPAVTEERLAPASHAPACFAGEHSFEVDVWSIGRLMEQVALELEPRMQLLLGDLASSLQAHYSTLTIADVARQFAAITAPELQPAPLDASA